MTFDRAFWDEVMPPTSQLQVWAVVTCGLWPATQTTEVLEYLAAIEEDDMHSRPPDDWPAAAHAFIDWAHIECSSLRYKPTNRYLTLEGYVLGTKGWYVTVECGMRWHVTGDTVATTLARTVIFVECVKEWRRLGRSKAAGAPGIDEVVRRHCRRLRETLFPDVFAVGRPRPT